MLTICCLLMACETENQYSSRYCYFEFQGNLYPTSALNRSVKANGQFCITKAVMENGVWHLKLTPNQGSYAASDLDLVMGTYVDNKRLSFSSMGYQMGLIIGRNNRGVLCAYDLQCPNCDHAYPLTWGDGLFDLKCKRCQRIYNIEGDYGYVREGDKGHILTQYKNVGYNPTNERLTVSN